MTPWSRVVPALLVLIGSVDIFYIDHVLGIMEIVAHQQMSHLLGLDKNICHVNML